MNAPAAPRRRLTRSADFDAVYRRGRSRSSRHLVAYVFAREDGDRSEGLRIGVTVPRKVGTAVVRNAVKRRLREVAAQVAATLPAGSDLVLVARPGLHEAVEANGYDWLVDELRGLVAGGEA